MSTFNGIISFPTLFTPQTPKGATEAKFSAALLIPPGDPQIALIQAEVEAAKLNTFPSGFPANADLCFGPYDVKYQGKDYYDPRFTGWFVLTTTAKADDRPTVVDVNMQKIIDPGAVRPGTVGWLSCGISGYVKGTGGVGGWLNGFMSTGEPNPQFGFLDNKPTAEQMFGNVAATASQTMVAPQTAPAAPAPNAPPVAPAPNAPPQYVMTEKAAGHTRDQLLANGQGWTDELLLSQGMMIDPSFA